MAWLGYPRNPIRNLADRENPKHLQVYQSCHLRVVLLLISSILLPLNSYPSPLSPFQGTDDPAFSFPAEPLPMLLLDPNEPDKNR